MQQRTLVDIHEWYRQLQEDHQLRDGLPPPRRVVNAPELTAERRADVAAKINTQIQTVKNQQSSPDGPFSYPTESSTTAISSSVSPYSRYTV